MRTILDAAPIARLAMLLAIGVMLSVPAASAEQAPQLVDGKTTVYQRVLARKGATLHPSPGADASDTIRPFQPLYVYARRDDWIQVGRGLHTGPQGWVPKASTVEWKQNLVVSFSNPAGRERQLLFESEQDLMNVVKNEAPIALAKSLREKAIAGGPGAAPGVAALEPAEAVPIEQNFYMFPILDWREEEHPMTFEIMRVLELAALPLEDQSSNDAPEEPPTVGVAFVIDTTRSMQPYIDATREAVNAIVDRISASEAGAHVRFAAIGFRDSPEAVRERDPSQDIEYRTKVFLRLSADQPPEQVRSAFAAIHEAQVSTVNFHEDAVSGIVQAINMPEWDTAGKDGGPIQQRYIVVISDASPKPPRDPSLPPEVRDLDWSSVRQIADDKDIALAAIHAKTPDGAPNHRVAAAAYQELTRTPNNGPSNYYPVDLASADGTAFSPAVKKFSDSVAAQYRQTLDDLQAASRERELSAIEQASLAMRLRWLGRARNASAPELIEAWALDRALENPLVPALDVRLLVTKNQLSTMRDVLAEIVQAGEVTQGGLREGEFFELLRGALARMAQDPGVLVNTRFETLDQAIGEFLNDLPYRSQILENITPERWINMGPERRAVLDRVAARKQLYEHYASNPELWTALYDGAPDGERVFAMPLESLP